MLTLSSARASLRADGQLLVEAMKLTWTTDQTPRSEAKLRWHGQGCAR